MRIQSPHQTLRLMRLAPAAVVALAIIILVGLPGATPAGAAPGPVAVLATDSPGPTASTSPTPGGSASPSPSTSPSPSPSTSPAPTREPVTIAAAIASGVVTGGRGFRTGTIVVRRSASGAAAVTLRFRVADDHLGGQLAEVWVRTVSRGWRMLALRRFSALDGIGAEIQLSRSVREWTGFRLRYLGDSTHRGAWGPAVYALVR